MLQLKSSKEMTNKIYEVIGMYQVKMEYLKKFSHVSTAEFCEVLEVGEMGSTYGSYLIDKLIDKYEVTTDSDVIEQLYDLKNALRDGKIIEYIENYSMTDIISFSEMDLFLEIREA